MNPEGGVGLPTKGIHLDEGSLLGMSSCVALSLFPGQWELPETLAPMSTGAVLKLRWGTSSLENANGEINGGQIGRSVVHLIPGPEWKYN